MCSQMHVKGFSLHLKLLEEFERDFYSLEMLWVLRVQGVISVSPLGNISKFKFRFYKVDLSNILF